MIIFTTGWLFLINIFQTWRDFLQIVRIKRNISIIIVLCTSWNRMWPCTRLFIWHTLTEIHRFSYRRKVEDPLKLSVLLKHSSFKTTSLETDNSQSDEAGYFSCENKYQSNNEKLSEKRLTLFEKSKILLFSLIINKLKQWESE